jgi:D-glycero-D-manno-heptose 1,7-bisphosphate phosphatase
MLHAIAERFKVELERAPCVGDSLRDLQAAAAVGAQPILVLTGKGRKTRTAGNLPEATTIYPDLAAVAQALCQ